MLLLCAAILGIIILWHKRLASRRQLYVATLAVTLLYALSCPATVAFLTRGIETYHPLMHQRPSEPHAIVVLGAGIHRPGTLMPHAELNEASLTRTLYAADLYRRGPACPVIASGRMADEPDTLPSLAHVMADLLERQGVAPADAIAEVDSMDTWTNAVHATRLAREAGYEHVVVVTDALHMPRAVKCFEAQGITVTPAPCMHRSGAAILRYNYRDLFPDPDAAVLLKRLVRELAGYAWYHLDGKL